MVNNLLLRATGRSTRAIEYAKHLSKFEKVYLVVLQEHVKIFQDLIKEFPNIIVVGHLCSMIDYPLLRMRGTDNKTIFDHEVIYRRYNKLIDMYLADFRND